MLYTAALGKIDMYIGHVNHWPAAPTRHFCHDLELDGGDLISSPVDSIASLVSPKKSYVPNSVGKNYFSATPFFTFSKNATGGHNA